MRKKWVHGIGFCALIAGGFFLSPGGGPCATAWGGYLDSTCARAPAANPEEVFKAKGLTKFGFLLITGDEAGLHTAAASIKTLKAKVTNEALSRASSVRSLQIGEDALGKIDAQLLDMRNQLDALKNRPAEYNQVVDNYNATLKQFKVRQAALEDLKKKQEKQVNSQPVYNETVIAAAEKSDAAMAAYTELANDPELSSAIIQYNKTAPQAVKLGPSGGCTADIAFLKKCISEMEADGIPARMEGGVPHVEVIINGKKREMLWDSGAGTVLLSAESAEEFGLRVPADSPVMQGQAADGRLIEMRVITIPEIRVGPFSAQNVEAAVAPKGKTRGDDLLGGTFQNHFQCRLDQEAGVLHLTPNPVAAIHSTASAGPATVGGDIFQTNGLTRAGDLIVAQQESEIHTAILSLHGLKTKVASEASARTSMSAAVQKAADTFFSLGNDLDTIEAQMEKVKGNQTEYNKLVDPYNATLKEFRTRRATLIELRKKMGKMGDSQSLYTESALTLGKRVDGIIAQYAAVAKDAGIKAAIDALNKGAAKPVALGRSANFAADADFLKQSLVEIANEGVPIRIEGGVPNVEVTIGGKTIEMIWDSGASFVSFSAETAADLGLHPSPSDKTVELEVADGKKVECKMMVVPSISVGGYTAQNVTCVIDPPGGAKSPDLLGGTFQSQFLCRLDQKALVLHLTPNDVQASARPAPPGMGIGPKAAPPSNSAAAPKPAAAPVQAAPDRSWMIADGPWARRWTEKGAALAPDLAVQTYVVFANGTRVKKAASWDLPFLREADGSLSITGAKFFQTFTKTGEVIHVNEWKSRADYLGKKPPVYVGVFEAL